MTPKPHYVGKWAPDIYLYHSDNTHYDLLVRDKSRLALNLLSVKESQESEWTTVSKRKQESKLATDSEKLLVEDENNDKEEVELEEEVTLLKGKNSGHRRIDPQTSAENIAFNVNENFKCSKCNCNLESQGLLDAHMKNHDVQKFHCEVCGVDFIEKAELEVHIREKHKSFQNLNQWNCNDCPFQANTADELVRHLKITAHQPSEKKKSLLIDYKQCYTCKLEFDGYWNLMEHRKNVHPSNKKCRNYPGGKCTFGSRSCKI